MPWAKSTRCTTAPLPVTARWPEADADALRGSTWGNPCGMAVDERTSPAARYVFIVPNVLSANSASDVGLMSTEPLGGGGP